MSNLPNKNKYGINFIIFISFLGEIMLNLLLLVSWSSTIDKENKRVMLTSYQDVQGPLLLEMLLVLLKLPPSLLISMFHQYHPNDILFSLNLVLP